MTNAPERIWIEDEFGDGYLVQCTYGNWYVRNYAGYDVEYVRADIVQALTAERDGLLRCVTDNHVALCRAEKAEAERDRLRVSNMQMLGDIAVAMGRIEALTAKVAELEACLERQGSGHREDLDEIANVSVERLRRAEAAEVERDRLREALKALHHAVCGETGFAEAVRLDSGLAYPWPALDIADEAARAALKGETP